MGNLRDHDYNFASVWSTAKGDELRRSIKAGECYCPLANASYTNMLCHPPTLASVGLTVAKGAASDMLSGKNGKSARLRSLPVINAADEARMNEQNGSNGNGQLLVPRSPADSKKGSKRELTVLENDEVKA